jgi:hypothetical protein
VLCRSARHLAKAKNERRIDRGVVVRLDETYLRSRYKSTHTFAWVWTNTEMLLHSPSRT